MRAMVFAAGKGTRLSPLTDERPKPAIPYCGRPMAAIALSVLAAAGIREVVLNTHHLGERLPELLAPAVPPGMQVSYLHEPVLLGTGGGLRNAREFLEGDDFVIINADIDFRPDLPAAMKYHMRHAATATMVVREHPDAFRKGAIESDVDGRVRRIVGHPEAVEGAELRAFMFTGVHILSSDAFDVLPQNGCIITHAYKHWVADPSRDVRAFVEAARFDDLGTLPAYLEAHLRALRERSVEASVDAQAEVHGHAKLTQTWVGAGATVEAVRLHQCVVWDGATVTSDHTRCIITPEQVVQVG